MAFLVLISYKVKGGGFAAGSDKRCELDGRPRSDSQQKVAASSEERGDKEAETSGDSEHTLLHQCTLGHGSAVSPRII